MTPVLLPGKGKPHLTLSVTLSGGAPAGTSHVDKLGLSWSYNPRTPSTQSNAPQVKS